jgi:hypothetical protein
MSSLLLATPVELASFAFVSPQGTLIIKSWRQLSRSFGGIEGLDVTFEHAFDCARCSAERSDRPILSLGPVRDILFQNAFDLSNGFRIRH